MLKVNAWVHVIINKNINETWVHVCKIRQYTNAWVHAKMSTRSNEDHNNKSSIIYRRY